MNKIMIIITLCFSLNTSVAQLPEFSKTKIGFSTGFHFFDNFKVSGSGTERFSSISLPGLSLSCDFQLNHSKKYFSQFSLGALAGYQHFGYTSDALENSIFDNPNNEIDRSFNDANFILNAFTFSSYYLNRRFSLNSKHFNNFIVGLGASAYLNLDYGSEQSGSNGYSYNGEPYNFFNYDLSNKNSSRINGTINLRVGTEKVIANKNSFNLFLNVNYSPFRIYEGTYTFNNVNTPASGTFSNNASSASFTIQYLFGIKKK